MSLNGRSQSNSQRASKIGFEAQAAGSLALAGLANQRVRSHVCEIVAHYGMRRTPPIGERLVTELINVLHDARDDAREAVIRVYKDVTDPADPSSPLYASFNDPQYRLGTATGLQRRMIEPEIRKHGVLVNVGCGNNALSSELARSFPGLERVIGTDIADHTIVSEDPRVEFRLQPDPSTLPLEDDAADGLLMYYVLHHASCAVEPLLREARRVLRPGGSLIVVEESWPEGDVRFEEAEPSTLLQHFRELNVDERLAVFRFIDWFTNHFLRGCFDMPLPYGFMTIEGWQTTLLRAGYQGNTRFLGFPILPLSPKLPVVIIVAAPSKEGGLERSSI